jgi:hypothetical protein
MFSRETQFQWAMKWPRKDLARRWIIRQNPPRRRHPERSRFSGGARDLPQIDSMFICHIQHQPYRAKEKRRNRPDNSCLHHDQRTKTSGSLNWHHGQSDPSRLAAQEQSDTELYQSLQLDPSRLLRTLRLSRCRHRQGKGNQRLAAQQENKAHRIHESALGRFGEGWGNEYKPEPAAADRREIPRPAGENAGLRDDASVMEPKGD